MVVLVVDVSGIFAFERKCNSPVTTYPHRPRAFSFTFQWMKAEAGQSHILWAGGCVKVRKNQAQAFCMIALNARF